MISARARKFWAMTNEEDQAHLDEILTSGVAATEVDGQKTTFVPPAAARKRLRELDQDDVAANGGRERRPTLARLRLWG